MMIEHVSEDSEYAENFDTVAIVILSSNIQLIGKVDSSFISSTEYEVSDVLPIFKPKYIQIHPTNQGTKVMLGPYSPFTETLDFYQISRLHILSLIPVGVDPALIDAYLKDIGEKVIEVPPTPGLILP